MKKDSQRHEPPDANNPAVAAALAALETARKSERVGSIAMAHVQLASTFAKSDLHADAVTEYDQLLHYLEMATADQRQESGRRAGSTNPAALTSRTDAVDLNRLEALARLNRVESLLALGRRDDAQAGLMRVAPMCRGFRRKTFRKKLAQLQNRLERTPEAVIPKPASGQRLHESQPAPTTDADAGSGPETTLAERLTAASATLSSGDARAAARDSLGIISDCGEDDHCRAQARQVLGMALDVLGKSEESLATMKLSFTDYLASGYSAQAANLAIPMAIRLESTGEGPDAIALIEHCLTETQDSLSDSVQARLLTILGRFQDQDDDRTGARRNLEAACQIAPDTQTMADAEHGFAVCLGNDDAADAEQSVESLALLDAAKSGYSTLESFDLVAGCEHEAAALLGRLKSFPAAGSRYQKALTGYQALNSQQNDSAWVAREIADCEQNILAIQSDETTDPVLFRSGGHNMSHESSL